MPQGVHRRGGLLKGLWPIDCALDLCVEVLNTNAGARHAEFPERGETVRPHVGWIDFQADLRLGGYLKMPVQHLAQPEQIIGAKEAGEPSTQM